MTGLPFSPDTVRKEGIQYYDPAESRRSDLPEDLRADVDAPLFCVEPSFIVPLMGEGSDGTTVRMSALCSVKTGKHSIASVFKGPGGEGRAVLTHREALRGEEDVYVCFEPLDSLAVIEAGATAMYANIPGRKLLVDLVAKKVPACRIMLIPSLPMGRDSFEERWWGEFCDALTQAGARVSIHWTDAPPYEVLTHGGPDAVRTLIGVVEAEREQVDTDEAEAYLSGAVGPSAEGFLDAITAPRPPAYSTGFQGLDEILGGGIRRGLYVLGANSSLGKTTLALQIADTVASAGHDVLFFTCEQSRDELIAKSVSRKTWENSRTGGNPQTAGAILYDLHHMSEADRDYVEGNVWEYSREAGSLWIVQDDDKREDGTERIGLDTIVRCIERHREIMGRDRGLVVFVDYLQILYTEPPRPGMKAPDRRQEIDDAMTVLRRLTRDDTNTAVFVISSKSRASYSSSPDMGGFKESGTIEYSADVVLDWVPRKLVENPPKDDRMAVKELENARSSLDREMVLKVLKNRMGRVGSVNLLYHAMYNCFEESAPAPSDDEEVEGYVSFNR